MLGIGRIASNTCHDLKAPHEAGGETISIKPAKICAAHDIPTALLRDFDAMKCLETRKDAPYCLVLSIDYTGSAKKGANQLAVFLNRFEILLDPIL